MSENSFDLSQDLPIRQLDDIAERLVGFSLRYEQIKNHIKIMLSHEELGRWSQKFHGQVIPLCEVISQRYPLFLFSGDVGSGKTITAECIANRLTREMKKEGSLLKLSTRVRGRGLHGEMSQLIQNAFDELVKQAGKKRLSFLLIDEADSIASLRTTEQMHQEEKAAVNTLIQKLDAIRQIKGRAVVFLCTNRIHAIDQAIVRRSALHCEFSRPSKEEILELLKMDLGGLKLKESELDELATLSSSGGAHGEDGYTFSDFRLRFLPEAVIHSFPDKGLTFDILKETILKVRPSPRMI